MTRLRIGAGCLGGAGPVLVVSPHLDDGVMSCGCLIAGLARRRPVVVATVFAGRSRLTVLTEWDRAAGFLPDSDVVGARRAEDRAACAILRAGHRWLPFRDSQYGETPRAAAVARRIASLPVWRAPDAAVVWPLGLFHSDHRLVHEAMLMLWRRQPRHALWLAYADVPYRRLPGLAAAALARLRRAGLAPRRARVAADADLVRRKAQAVACYVSQRRALATPGRLGNADASAEEHYWQLGHRPQRPGARLPP